MKLKLLLIPLIFILSLVIVNSQSLTVDDAVAVYRFEEGSGSICQDSTANNLTGTFTGTTFISSKGNNGTGDFATRYDGVDDFCVVPDNDLLNLSQPFSISMWINKTDVGDDDFIIYKNVDGTDTNYGVSVTSTEEVNVFQRVLGETTREVETSTQLKMDEWVHIVVIVNGTTGTDAFIYFNGTQQPTVSGANFGFDAPDEDLYIGTDADLVSDFDGDIDEVYIFNFSLSDAQITNLFENGIPGEITFNATNLDVFQSKNPVEILEEFTLFANFTNSTDGQAIPNATCFANSSIVGGGQAGFGRGILGIGELSTIDNAVHTQVNDIFGNNTLRVDIDGLPLGKVSYGVNFRFHAHNQTPDDALRVFGTCHPGNLTFSNFTFLDQVNATNTVISTSEGNDTFWGFKNVVLFGTAVASPNCSIVFESQNTSADKHWMIADTTTSFNLDNSFTSDDFGETYTIRPNADERSPFVDAGFGLDVPDETTMTFNATSGLYFLPNIRHGRPFDFNDRVFCSAPPFENNTNFVVTNVQDNVAPIVQIASIEPTVAVINVSNVTINWNTNDPELLTDFINVSFPNGSLLIQSTLKPLILTPTELTVLGNYTVIVFANDTGGLFSLANDSFEVANIDVVDPVITLISPTNNTVNNTVPLLITFSVTDNFPNDIICRLSNSTTTFDEGTFTQSATSTLTLALGFIAISQQFPNLELTCFDNTLPFNNSATLNLNYTLDTIPPIIIPASPLNLSRFNKQIISEVNILATCTDVPVFRFNITISNTTNEIASFENLIPINDVLTIDEILDISTLGDGNYTLDYECADPHTKRIIKDYTIRKNTSNNAIKFIPDPKNVVKEFRIRYIDNGLTVTDFGSTKAEDDSRYKFFFNTNETETSTKRTFTFEIISRSQVYHLPDSAYKGHFVTGNNFIDFEFGDNRAEYEVIQNGAGNFEIKITTTKTNLNFNSVGDLNLATLQTQFEVFSIVQTVDLFKVTECRTDTGSVLLLSLFIFIALILVSMGFATNVGFVGLFGALLLWITSWFVAPCIAIVALLLTLLSMLLAFYFIARGFFPNLPRSMPQ